MFKCNKHAFALGFKSNITIDGVIVSMDKVVAAAQGGSAEAVAKVVDLIEQRKVAVTARKATTPKKAQSRTSCLNAANKAIAALTGIPAETAAFTFTADPLPKAKRSRKAKAKAVSANDSFVNLLRAAKAAGIDIDAAFKAL